MKFLRQWWMFVISCLMLVYGFVSINLGPGRSLTTFGDLTALFLILFATAVMAANGIANRGQTRAFWLLIASGCMLWGITQAMWTFYEVLLHRDVPDPFVGDVILFLHIVPFIAAVVLRPHRPPEERKLYLSTLNFLVLLIWWVFLYAFIVFPDQYVVSNLAVYSRSYDVLYLLESLMLLFALAIITTQARAAWQEIYRNLLIAAGMYTLGSMSINAAIAHGRYYSGSLYDIPYVASIGWMIWVALLAWERRPECGPLPGQPARWITLPPRLAMLATLSLPVFGFWTIFLSSASGPVRHFRLVTTMAAMLVLGFFVFIRQYLQDHELLRLLEQSRLGLENLQRLQAQAVQKEKLVALGQLVAGAAHEINNPLTAILGYAELLATSDNAGEQHSAIAHKIGQQARRTRDLVAGLLNFAQQSSEDKSLLDLGALVQRVVQMELFRLESKKIRLQSWVSPGLPRIWGNSNQLFQCFQHILNNAADALERTGGEISINAWLEQGSIVLEFCDTGPGIQEPDRVFDPFYTTKPVGKGAGLGLSATYGVVRDHGGQISCHNRLAGGASFVLRFPVAKQAAAYLEADAAKV